MAFTITKEIKKIITFDKKHFKGNDNIKILYPDNI